MARKEEIIQKAQELAKKAKPVAEYMPMSAIIAACVDMAEWTLNNLWHDASEMPELEKELLVITYTLTDVLKFVKILHEEDEWCLIDGDKWCYLDDILPDNK